VRVVEYVVFLLVGNDSLLGGYEYVEVMPRGVRANYHWKILIIFSRVGCDDPEMVVIILGIRIGWLVSSNILGLSQVPLVVEVWHLTHCCDYMDTEQR